MRLIDADNMDIYKLDYLGTEDISDWIKSQPTVDAIVPVYCKDCKYFQSYVDDITGKAFNCGYCHKWNRDNKMMINDTDYCSHGERKDDRNGE